MSGQSTALCDYAYALPILLLQDEEVGQYLMDMMKNGLKAINQYKYSGEESQRILAEKYQEALSTSLV